MNGREYLSFLPVDLPPNPPVREDPEMRALLMLANKELGYLRTAVEGLSNPENFIKLCVWREALFSSRIEGSRVTLDEMLAPDLEENGSKEAVDAFNNARAVFSSVEALQKQGDALDLELLRDAHRVLFTRDGAGGRRAGEFRTEQNWIGPKGCPLDSASFVPPNPQDMMNGLRALEDFMNRESDLDPLLRTGLLHYQFETLHPFADGNGRIGRLLILLYLLDQKEICSPYLCLSYRFSLYRSHYYDALQHVREEGDYETWLKFFLRAVEAAAEEALTTMVKLERVRKASAAAVLENCSGAVRRAKRTAFLEYLEKRPIIEIGRTAKDLGWTFPTASKFVKEFVEAGILKETSGRRRNRVFSYETYLNVLRHGLKTDDF